ncbi:hypothetical protein HDV57DRAFT_480308 [Trichoderma longibrachiatum]
MRRWYGVALLTLSTLDGLPCLLHHLASCLHVPRPLPIAPCSVHLLSALVWPTLPSRMVAYDQLLASPASQSLWPLVFIARQSASPSI